MDFDFSWRALLKPGEAACYFDEHANRPFDVDAIGYNAINAWWLAVCSQLIYRKEDDETKNVAHLHRRKVVFEAVHLQETAFWQTREGTQCALLQSTTTEPFAILVFRGTQGLTDWFHNIRFLKTDWAETGCVHTGFIRALQPVWEEILEKLQSLQCPLFYTGHSLGAALATLAAALHPPHAVYTFGSPRVGDSTFVASLEKTPIYRIVNNRDMVSSVPQSFLGYQHVGEQHRFGRNSTAIINPTPADLKTLRQTKYLTTDPKQKWRHPPEPMSDHAPVNYVVHLERAVTTGLRQKTIS